MDHNSLLRLSRKKVNHKRRYLSDGYKADPENTENILTPALQKPRKSKQINLISEQEISGSSKPSETEDNPMLSVIQEEEINLLSENSEWEHFSPSPVIKVP